MQTSEVLIPFRTPGGDYTIVETSPDNLDWPELRAIWSEGAIKFPACFTAPEEKLEIFYYYACRKAGLPASVGTVFNPSWSQLLIDTIQHDCLLISASLVSYVVNNSLFERNLSQFSQVIVVGEGNPELACGLKEKASNLQVYLLSHPLLDIQE